MWNLTKNYDKMSDEQLEKLATGNYVAVPKWEYYLKYITLLGVVYLIFYIGSWTKNQEATMFNHLKNDDEHRTLKEAQKEFITRREFDLTLKNIEGSLQTIKNEIKR